MHRRIFIRAAFATLLPALQLTSFRMLSAIPIKTLCPLAARGLSSASATPIRTGRILSGIQPSGSLHLGNYLGNESMLMIAVTA